MGLIIDKSELVLAMAWPKMDLINASGRQWFDKI